MVRFSAALRDDTKNGPCSRLETRYAKNHIFKNTKTPPCKESYNGAAQVTQCGVHLANLSLSPIDKPGYARLLPTENLRED